MFIMRPGGKVDVTIGPKAFPIASAATAKPARAFCQQSRDSLTLRQGPLLQISQTKSNNLLLSSCIDYLCGRARRATSLMITIPGKEETRRL